MEGPERRSTVEGAANASAMWGTMRANLNNMVTGVSRVSKEAAAGRRRLPRPGPGDTLNLSSASPPPGGTARRREVECPTQTEILNWVSTSNGSGRVAVRDPRLSQTRAL